MKIQKFIFAVVVACLVLTACKAEIKKEVNSTIENNAKIEQLALNVSGMTCEVGCAKTIQSKLSKKEGVIDAKVIFTDSIATIKYDANKTSKADLISFVNGIAGGELYKSSENANYKFCDVNCKKACCASKEGKKCDTKCSADCKDKNCEKCAAKKAKCELECAAKNKTCDTNYSKCSADCKVKDCKKCAAKKAECKKEGTTKKSKSCPVDCKKECCKNKK